MCLAPLTVWVGTPAEGRWVQTACHKCRLCIANSVKDWVGRCIAEGMTSKVCHAVTLTYGRDRHYGAVDHVKAAVLTYSDVQLWLKRIADFEYRAADKAGVPRSRPRYFVTGEWGTLKGRAHWHVLMFWNGSYVPELQLGKEQVVQGHWDEGFSHWRKMNYLDAWYACKYILKGHGDLDQRVLPRMSKNPPLGAVWFADLAKRYVEQGLAPQDLNYRFPDVRFSNGSVPNFYLSGRSAELFLEAYIRAWRERWGDRQRPVSQLVDDFEQWGRVVNPETFEYRPKAEGGGVIRVLAEKAAKRGPVVAPDEAKKKRIIARMQFELLDEAVQAEADYRKWARAADGTPLVYVDEQGVPLRDERGFPRFVLLEDWVQWQQDDPKEPEMISRKAHFLTE